MTEQVPVRATIEAGLALGLDPTLAAQRARLIATRGDFARTMRLLERRTWRAPEWLAEVWAWVLHLVAGRGYRPDTTGANYARALGRFADWVDAEGLDYATLELRALDGWQQRMFEQQHSTNWRKLQLHAVRSFYGWRASRGLGTNCTDGLKGPRKVKRQARKYTRGDLRLMMQATRAAQSELLELRDRTLLLMLYATGARREEIATLRLDQVEVTDKGRVAIVRFLGKGAKEREVPFEGPAVEHLVRWLDARSRVPNLRTDCVFVAVWNHFAGSPLSVDSIEHIVKRYARTAGLASWGVHRFRVTFATRLYDDGFDLERIRILMGHESIETTRRYLAVSDRMRRVRLKAIHQHDALGTRPAGFPLWAEKLSTGQHGAPTIPTR